MGRALGKHLTRLAAAPAPGEIIVVPSCNPIGLSQVFLTSHVGRYHAASGLNYNRRIPDTTDAVAAALEGRLTRNPDENAELLRRALADAAAKGAEAALRGEGSPTADLILKWCLLVRDRPLALASCLTHPARAAAPPRAAQFRRRRALPCPRRGSAEAVGRRGHRSRRPQRQRGGVAYVHIRLVLVRAPLRRRLPVALLPSSLSLTAWPLPALSCATPPARPEAADLAVAIKAQSVLIARDAGGDSYDDACLHPHTNVRERFPDTPFPEARRRASSASLIDELSQLSSACGG